MTIASWLKSSNSVATQTKAHSEKENNDLKQNEIEIPPPSRARLLLPRILRRIAMEIEGYALDTLDEKQLLKHINKSLSREMEDLLTSKEKLKRKKIQDAKVFFTSLFIFSILGVLFIMAVESGWFD